MKTEAENQARKILAEYSGLSQSQAINSAISSAEKEIAQTRLLLKETDDRVLAFTSIILTKMEVVEILKQKLKS